MPDLSRKTMPRCRDIAPLLRCRRGLRRGAVLLEVILSIGILLMAMVGVGVVFRNGLYHIDMAEQMSRARVMTERLIAEMDTGYLDMEQQEQSGYFSEEAPPGMSWRVVMLPHEKIKRLVTIDIEILKGDPTSSGEDGRLLLYTRILRPEPKGMDLKEDFGLDDEQIAKLAEVIPGGAAVFDPNDFDPRSLAQLELQDLADLLPTLIQAFGTSFLGGQLSGLVDAAQKGDTQGLQDMAGQLQGGLGGQLQGGAGGQQQGGTQGGRQQGGTRTSIGGGK